MAKAQRASQTPKRWVDEDAQRQKETVERALIEFCIVFRVQNRRRTERGNGRGRKLTPRGRKRKAGAGSESGERRKETEGTEELYLDNCTKNDSMI